MVCHPEDRVGGSNRTIYHSEALVFERLCRTAKCVDAGCPGIGHSWSNKRSGKYHIMVRLDRFYIPIRDSDGSSVFVELKASGSDHNLIICHWQGAIVGPKNNFFKCNSELLKEEAFKQNFNSMWQLFPKPRPGGDGWMDWWIATTKKVRGWLKEIEKERKRDKNSQRNHLEENLIIVRKELRLTLRMLGLELRRTPSLEY